MDEKRGRTDSNAPSPPEHHRKEEPNIIGMLSLAILNKGMLSLAILLLCTAPFIQGDDQIYGTGHGRSDDPTKFSADRAKLFATFSNAAYCSAQSINAWDCAPCTRADPTFKVSKVINGPTAQTQVFIGSSNTTSDTGNIVISFRGSETFVNWLHDLNFPKKDAYPKCDGCAVHEGFLSAWTEIQDQVIQEVTALLASMPNALLFVTGHSLGAALAVLCATELGASKHSLGKKVEGVYTFGQPRVGNQAFHDFYGTGTRVSWRVTHNRDIVPHLPLEAMGFHHTSTEVFYNENFSTVRICDGSGEDKKCSDQFDVPSISDHLHYMNMSISDC